MKGFSVKYFLGGLLSPCPVSDADATAEGPTISSAAGARDAEREAPAISARGAAPMQYRFDTTISALEI